MEISLKKKTDEILRKGPDSCSKKKKIKQNKTSSATSFWIWCCLRACSWAVPSIAPAHTIVSQERNQFERLGTGIAFSSSLTRKARAPRSSLQERTQDQTSGCGSTMRKGKNSPIALWKACSFRCRLVSALPRVTFQVIGGFPTATLSVSDDMLKNLTLPVGSLWRLGTWNGVLQSIVLIHRSLVCTRSRYSCKT